MTVSRILILLSPIVLAACVSIGSSRPARETTVVVPQGSGAATVVCSNGSPPPCS